MAVIYITLIPLLIFDHTYTLMQGYVRFSRVSILTAAAADTVGGISHGETGEQSPALRIPHAHTDHMHEHVCMLGAVFYSHTWHCFILINAFADPELEKNRGLLPWLSLSETEGINLQGDGMGLHVWEGEREKENEKEGDREEKMKKVAKTEI